VILFDTDVLVAHLRGDERARALLSAAVTSDEACCSVLTAAELRAGMRSAERRVTLGLLGALDQLPVTAEIAAMAGDWSRQYRGSHSGIGLVDYLIAATAHVAGADLKTLNVRHYPMLKGLRPAF
jgi:predicted nucleic acid-binding protein